MVMADFRLFLDNNPAESSMADLVRDVRVDQAVDMAAEAEVRVELSADERGQWPGMDEAFAQPFARVRVEVKVGAGEFTHLIDGPVVAQRFELSAMPDQSVLVLVIHDDSVLLNQSERVELFEDLAAHEIAEQVFLAHGLEPDVDTTPSVNTPLTRAVVQRGTAMRLLRELARRHGMFTYVRAGTIPGSSVGVFARPNLTAGDLPELLLMGRDRNINAFTAEFNGLRPLSARAETIRISDKQPLAAEAATASLTALGDTPVHAMVQPGQSLLAYTGEDEGDLQAATAASVDLSSWAYSATAETTADIYPAVLSPYRVIRVAGAGGVLSGDYFISQVRHRIDHDGYGQQVTLRRNACSRASASAGASGAGVF